MAVYYYPYSCRSAVTRTGPVQSPFTDAAQIIIEEPSLSLAIPRLLHCSVIAKQEDVLALPRILPPSCKFRSIELPRL